MIKISAKESKFNISPEFGKQNFLYININGKDVQYNFNEEIDSKLLEKLFNETLFIYNTEKQ